MAEILLIFLTFFLLYLMLLRGRTGHPGLIILRKYLYAHRGLYGPGIPENSLPAFKSAVSCGYGIELDLHLLKDGTLAVMHDSDLKRMTGKAGILEDLGKEDLCQFHLGSTKEHIPVFSEVLNICQGKVPLIIELKTRNGNASALAEAACRLLDSYEGPFCLESFDPACLLWLKKNRPKILRGQLSENFMKAENSPFSLPLKLAGSCHLESFLTRPDFIAHKYRDRKTLSNFLIRRFWHVQGITWTVQDQDALMQAQKEGWIPIFEGFLPDIPDRP